MGEGIQVGGSLNQPCCVCCIGYCVWVVSGLANRTSVSTL